MSRWSLKLDRSLVESEPRAKTAHITIPLRHRVQQIDDLPVHQTEVACIGWDLDISESAKNSIEQEIRCALERADSLSSELLRIYDLEPLTPFCEHVENQFRRILKV